MSGGGEFLKGVLDESLGVSRLKYYVVDCPPVAAGAVSRGRVKIETATRFLAQNICAQSISGGSGSVIGVRFNVRLSTLTNNREFQSTSFPIGNFFGQCINQTVDLPEYIYVDENEYLSVEYMSGFANTGLSLVLGGVEYRKLS